MSPSTEKSVLSFSLQPLKVAERDYYFANLNDLDPVGPWRKLPYCLKILLENVWRHYDEKTVCYDDLKAIIERPYTNHSVKEISFRPARVLMQDFSGVPAIVDLAAMRDAIQAQNGNPSRVNPLIPVDLVIDHSVMIDYHGSQDALSKNVQLEYQRNLERFTFLKWGTKAFQNFRVVPPGNGICHQVNLEYLSKVVWVNDNNPYHQLIYPDTVVGTDSHTTMVNGLGVLGWGVGGIEAEAAMLGRPTPMLIPSVLGVRLVGRLKAGCTATDLVLTITETLRQKGVVGYFVEFFGEGVDHLSLADRATIANMAPEYGATCGIFGIDDETLRYLRLTGRSQEHINVVEAYAKTQGLWRTADEELCYNETLEINLSFVNPCLAGPKRPQDRVILSDLKQTTEHLAPLKLDDAKDATRSLNHHDVVIAAITSCTNTSNPAVMIAAGLVARKAREFGLTTKPWVKTSIAPGSKVVTDYLEKSGLLKDLEALGFYITGYGCTTCIGNSGPLYEDVVKQIEAKNLIVSSVLSGNRNFEGRIHPYVKANYLASPPLVVAFALAGTTHIDLTKEPIGIGQDGTAIYLKDIWPYESEINALIESVMNPGLFKHRYAFIFEGDQYWQNIQVEPTQIYQFDPKSTYVKKPPFFLSEDHITHDDEIRMPKRNQGNIIGARILALLKDSITTDHISPAGSIKEQSPAGQYLLKKNVEVHNFNSYGSRRGNHEVMVRATFGNIRLQNEIVPEKTGGYTRIFDENYPDPLPIFDAAQYYLKHDIPLVVIAGREYGTGSSRDWAAKGAQLLGVQAVIAESFERIHRSNLVGMGVLPLVFESGTNRETLGIKGDEVIDIVGFDDDFTMVPQMTLRLKIHSSDGKCMEIPVQCCVNTEEEIHYLKAGSILHYVYEGILKKGK